MPLPTTRKLASELKVGDIIVNPYNREQNIYVAHTHQTGDFTAVLEESALLRNDLEVEVYDPIEMPTHFTIANKAEPRRHTEWFAGDRVKAWAHWPDGSTTEAHVDAVGSFSGDTEIVIVWDTP